MPSCALAPESERPVRTIAASTRPAWRELLGAGVYYGSAPREAAYHRDGHVVVVGGANSAGQAALYLAEFAAHVTLVVRAEVVG